eukprot:CAMPEP_0196595602 /NCGR_PEP_ID=MMETSP1081-20130531/81561_1 /TAXON_ID=36882 /ORGANISM="Pyramimonas amylifera, Strain CCMP720" /LENGTH=58 /DNA_ID=CAMNT_0041920231 /DNA_START=1 /DNA_END=174 /DNA_ORIENTATION=-
MARNQLEGAGTEAGTWEEAEISLREALAEGLQNEAKERTAALEGIQASLHSSSVPLSE